MIYQQDGQSVSVGNPQSFYVPPGNWLLLSRSNNPLLVQFDQDVPIMVRSGATVFGWPGPDGAPAAEGFVYAHNYDAMSYAIDQGMEHRLGMHFAIFEPGWLRNVLAYWRAGRLSPGSFVKFYFGGPYGILARGQGVTFGLPPTLTGLAAYRELLEVEGCDLPWFSAAVGGDRAGCRHRAAGAACSA